MTDQRIKNQILFLLEIEVESFRHIFCIHNQLIYIQTQLMKYVISN